VFLFPFSLDSVATGLTRSFVVVARNPLKKQQNITIAIDEGPSTTHRTSSPQFVITDIVSNT
jgi:hypothetical protein